MAATEQSLEATESKQSSLARLINAKGERVPLMDADGDPLGIFITLDPFDGATKLQWDNKTLAANILKGSKRDKETLKCYVWLWERKVTGIEGVPADDPMLEGVSPKAWFTSNEDGLVWVKAVIDEYYRRQVARTGDGKN